MMQEVQHDLDIFIISFYSSLLEELVVPLQEKLEDWKRSAVQIDKDHSRGLSTTAATSYTSQPSLPPLPASHSICDHSLSG